jgi:hypothetical protein
VGRRRTKVFRDVEDASGHAPVAANRRQGTLAVYRPEGAACCPSRPRRPTDASCHIDPGQALPAAGTRLLRRRPVLPEPAGRRRPALAAVPAGYRLATSRPWTASARPIALPAAVHQPDALPDSPKQGLGSLAPRIPRRHVTTPAHLTTRTSRPCHVFQPHRMACRPPCGPVCSGNGPGCSRLGDEEFFVHLLRLYPERHPVHGLVVRTPPA